MVVKLKQVKLKSTLSTFLFVIKFIVGDSMKRKGFTLVEMLAVIAILGILVLLVLPNVLKNYRDAKKIAFIDEAKAVYTQATDKYVTEKTKGNKIGLIEKDGTNETHPLALANAEDLSYTIRLDNNGQVTAFKLTNGELCIVGVGDFLGSYAKEDVLDLSDEEAKEKCAVTALNDNQKFILRLQNKTTVKTDHDPKMIYLKYNDGWYSDNNMHRKITNVTIPYKENNYYKGAWATNTIGSKIQAISCNGSIVPGPDGGGIFTGREEKPYVEAISRFEKKYYHVVFTGGESGSLTMEPCYYGASECHLPSNKDSNGYGKDIKKTGYLFTGWKDTKTNKIYADGASLPILTDANENEEEYKAYKFDNAKVCSGEQDIDNKITFTAKWEPITYQVAYNCNGGMGSTATSTHTYDIKKNLTANGCTRSGYKFLGWSGNNMAKLADFSNEDSVINLANTQGAIVTLYAVWKLELTTNKLIVDANGGHGGFEVTQKEKTTVNINVSLDASHRFGSWDASGTCGTFEQKASTTYTFPRGDNTECRLKANWEKYSNILVVDANGGSGDISVSKYGGETQAISVNRCGYTFGGWEKTGDCGTYGSTASTTYTFPYKFGTRCTLKAKWFTYGYTVDACIKENESKTYPTCLSSVTVNRNNDEGCKILSSATNLDAIRWIKSDYSYGNAGNLKAYCPTNCKTLGYAYWGGGDGSTAPTANKAVNGNTCWCGYKTSDVSCGITWIKSDYSYSRYSETASYCPKNCAALKYQYWGGSSSNAAPVIAGKSSGNTCWCGYSSTDVSCGINWVKSDYSYSRYSETASYCPTNCKTLGYQYWGGSSESTQPASPGKSNGNRCWCGYGINTKTCGVVWVKSDYSYSRYSETASHCPNNCAALKYEYWGGSSSSTPPEKAGQSLGNTCWCGYKGSDVSCGITWIKSDYSYSRYSETASNCPNNCAALKYEYWGGSSSSTPPVTAGKSNGNTCWCGYNSAENRTDITWVKSDYSYLRYSVTASNCPTNCKTLGYKYWGGSSENQAPLVPGKSNGNRCWCGIDTVVDTRNLTWIRSDYTYGNYSNAATHCPTNCKTLGYQYWGSNNSNTSHPTKVGVSEGTNCWCAYNTSENRTNISWIKSDYSYLRYSETASHCPNNCKTLGYDYWGGTSENAAPIVPSKSNGTRCWCGYNTVAENKNLTWVRSDYTYGNYSNAATYCPNNCKTLGYQYWGSNNSDTSHPTILNRSNGKNCWCAYNTSENRTDLTWVRSDYSYSRYSETASHCPTNCKTLGYQYWGGSMENKAPIVPGKSNGNWCWCSYNKSEDRTDITWIRSDYSYSRYSETASHCPTNCKTLGYKYWGGSNASTAPLVPGKSNGNWCWCGK